MPYLTVQNSLPIKAKMSADGMTRAAERYVFQNAAAHWVEKRDYRIFGRF